MTDLKQALKGIDKKAQRDVRILTVDIETKPNAGFHWGLWQQNISLPQIIEVSEVMCFAAKWYGEKATHFHAEWQGGGREEMVQAAHDLLSEADIVVGYNSQRFDMPNLNKEFALAGMAPPKPYKQVDLMKVVKSEFRFASNKLDHVAQQLGLGAKTQHTGFQLWIDCMAGDEKAHRLMEKYNRQDVKLTESLLDRLRPWIKGHPQLSLYTGVPWSCTNCGHAMDPETFTEVAHTSVQSYAAAQCPNCGHWVRENARLAPPAKTRSVR